LRKYVPLRLDEMLSAADGPVFRHKLITIEHVLPQTPRAGSEWCEKFNPAERAEWTHRLANLVGSTGRKTPKRPGSTSMIRRWNTSAARTRRHVRPDRAGTRQA